MSMRINHKVLSIPPYISTSWKNICSLQSKKEDGKHLLLIYLQDKSCITVPEIEEVVIKAIFEAHAKHLEIENKASVQSVNKKSQTPATSPDSNIKSFEMGSVNSLACHNEAERNAPDLPPYILTKVEQISKEMGLSNSATLPFPEPNCNCPFCQIAKSMQKSSEAEVSFTSFEEDEEEEISLEDLSFTSWMIRPLKTNLYQVVHPDEPEKNYEVFLDSPIGCTCGSNRCEHIKAVLTS